MGVSHLPYDFLQVTAICRKVYQNPQQPEDDMEIGAACIVSLPGKKIAYIADVVKTVNSTFLQRARRKVDIIRWVQSPGCAIRVKQTLQHELAGICLLDFEGLRSIWHC